MFRLDGYKKIIEALKTETPLIGAGGITTKDVTDILATGISDLKGEKIISYFSYNQKCAIFTIFVLKYCLRQQYYVLF